MPTVPTYQGGVSENGIQGGLRYDAPIEAFGGGKAAPQVPEMLLKSGEAIVLAEKNRFDQVNVQDYDTKVSQLATDIQSKAALLKGRDAIQTHDFIQEEWTKGKANLDSMLNNDAQKGAGAKIANSHFDNLYKFGATHTRQQLDQYDTESTNASIDNYANVAAQNFNNPKAVSDALKNQQGLIERFAQRNGLGADWIKDNVTKNASNVHAAVIKQYVDMGMDNQAKAYFEANKSSMNAPTVEAARHLVDESTTLGAAQRTAQSYIAKGLSSQEALQSIAEIDNPKLQKATRQEYELRQTAIDKAVKQDQEQFYEGVAKQVWQTNALPPTSDLAKLSQEQRNKVYDQLTKQNKRESVPDNSPKYQEMLLMATTPDTRQLFMDTNIFVPEIQTQMSPKDFEDVKKKWEGLREKDSSTTTALLDYMNGNNRIKRDAMERAGIKLDSTNQVIQQQKLNFDAEWNRQVLQQEQQLGRRLNTEETQKMADRFATNIVINKRDWYRLGMRGQESVINLTPEDIAVDEIPTKVRAEINSVLQSKGYPLTEKYIKDLYIRGLKSGDIQPNAQ